MAKRTQGTDLYAIDPDTGEIIDVGCVTSIDGIDTTVEQLEITCLQDTARQYMAGLATPGAATFGLSTDAENPDHVRLHQLKVAGRTLKWAVGWSEAPRLAPTVAANSAGEYDFVLPDARSWIVFEGFMNSFPFSFALNSVVSSNVGIQISGEPVLIARSGS